MTSVAQLKVSESVERLLEIDVDDNDDSEDAEFDSVLGVRCVPGDERLRYLVKWKDNAPVIYMYIRVIHVYTKSI